MTFAKPTLQQLLEAGVYFGHRTRRWNPKMAPYIFGKKNGIHIINLEKTLPMFDHALQITQAFASKGGRILFVSTKPSVGYIIAQIAEQTGQFYVNYRWLGGMLTNWTTVTKSIATLDKLEQQLTAEDVVKYTKKERIHLNRSYEKLKNTFAGIRKLQGLPDLVIVFDIDYDRNAVLESKHLGIPVIGVVDTNVDPSFVDYAIPGNDDSIKSVKLYTHFFAGAILSGTEQLLNQEEVQEVFVEEKVISEKEEVKLSSEENTQEHTQQSDEPISVSIDVEILAKKSAPKVEDKISALESTSHASSSKKPRVTKKDIAQDDNVKESVVEKSNTKASKVVKKKKDDVASPAKQKSLSVKKESPSDTSGLFELIKKLRDQTGAGMMIVKEALTESDNDYDKALLYLREKGLLTARKKSGRTAAEGVIVENVNPHRGVMLEINVETDFASHGKDFQSFVDKIALLLQTSSTVNTLDDLNQLPFDDEHNVAEATISMIAKLGENIVIRRFVQLNEEDGIIGSYIHNKVVDHQGKIGVLVQLHSSAPLEELKELVENLAVHIAASAPIYIDQQDIPQDVLENEKTTISKQIEQEGKPQNVLDKIVQGRLQKFYDNRVLLDQVYFIDGKTKIRDIIKGFEKDLNTSIHVSNFQRYWLGEGIDKKQEDFAKEVQGAMK